ncbi:MAG TPA: TRAP transporter large permease subunit [Myxococcota bacterium]|nr:TRAP transporter large permease subunit [Myxococcota bacterium]
MTAITMIVLFILALFGLPLFLILGTGAMVGYTASGNVLELYFAAFYRQVSTNPVFLAIPLFTLTGYMLAESKAPGRLVRISRACLGWLPGGLAMVALLTCAIFTAFTGASGVTIVALGGLLLPALLKDGYPRQFTMGLLTSSGSRGILFPPSLPLIVYAMIAGMTLQNIDAQTLAEIRKPKAVVEQVAASSDAPPARVEPSPQAEVDPVAAALAAEDEKDGGAVAAEPKAEVDPVAAALAEEDEKDGGAVAAEPKAEVDPVAAALAEEDEAERPAVDGEAVAAQEAASADSVAAVVPGGAEDVPASDDGEPFMMPSVDRLFVAGAVPGAFALLMIAIYAAWFGRKHKVPRTKFVLVEVFRAIRAIAWEIPVPIIVVGGILGGFFTAVEAAAFAAAWVFVVEVFIYKDIPIRRLPVVFRESMVLVGGILLILMSAQALTNFFIDVEVPQKLFTAVKDTISSPLTFLLVLNVFLLAVGMLMDIFSAIMVVVPIVAPVAVYYGINPVHLGIVILTNLEIGFNTPPVGVNLFVGSLAFRRPIVELVKAVLPFLIISVFALILITYWPSLTLWLVELTGVR